MNRFALFTDAGVNPQRRLGVGGYLLVPMTFLENEPHNIKQIEISEHFVTKTFEETSSTRLEVQTILWALKDVQAQLAGYTLEKLTIYTDSQCVAGLLGRRERLINCDFISKRSGLTLNNADLYREFYSAYDQLDFQVIKVSGHSSSSTHNNVDRIFSYVDKAVRKKLSIWMDSL